MNVHKMVIVNCIEVFDGHFVGSGMIEASRKALDEWVKGMPKKSPI
jgi:hypothetical protein